VSAGGLTDKTGGKYILVTGLSLFAIGMGSAAGGSPALAAQLHRLGAEVFSTGYVLAMRWTMVMPIAVVAIAAASCLAIRNKAAGQVRVAADAEDSQMAGTISSPGSSGSLGQSPGSSSGTAS